MDRIEARRVEILRVVGVALLILAAAASAHAQFRVYYWDSFEESAGRLPETLVHTNDGGPHMTQLFDFRSAEAPPGILGGIAGTECGRYGMRFAPKFNGAVAIGGVTHRNFLSRERLGATGCALVQADIYLPERETPMANIALVAQQFDPAKPKKLCLYRFGLSGGSSDKIYFSFTNGGDKPVTYVHANLDPKTVKRPGWHRFQMIFYGQDKIYCAIDTKFTSFSPIVDSTLKELGPGVVAVANNETRQHGPVYCDNLSIQWTPVATPDLPESPWSMNAPTARTNAKLVEADSSVGWHSNTESAWAESKRTGKPILVLFLVPNLPAYKYLSATCPNDDAAKAFFARFVPLRIDVNQLGGGQMAERFGITRVPLFMVMGTDGQPGAKALVENGKTQWADIVAAIGG